MDIRAYIDEYSQQKKFRGLPDKPGTICDLLTSQKNYALVQQEYYENSEYLAANIKLSVRGYTRDKKLQLESISTFWRFSKKKDLLLIFNSRQSIVLIPLNA